MNALPAAYDEAAYLRATLKATQARLAAVMMELGRVEGGLGYELETAKRRIVALEAENVELRGELADVREERDALEDVVHGDAS